MVTTDSHRILEEESDVEKYRKFRSFPETRGPGKVLKDSGGNLFVDHPEYFKDEDGIEIYQFHPYYGFSISNHIDDFNALAGAGWEVSFDRRSPYNPNTVQVTIKRASEKRIQKLLDKAEKELQEAKETVKVWRKHKDSFSKDFDILDLIYEKIPAIKKRIALLKSK